MAKLRIGNLLSQVRSKITNRIKESVLRPPAQKIVFAEFQNYKQAMIADFNNLPVVNALDYGPGYGDNDFANLLGANTGDLFSFLGFPRKAKPTNKIRNLLRRTIIEKVESPGLTLKWRVVMPSRAQIEEATKNDLPWVSGKSWVFWLEQGVPGLGNYLNLDNVGMPPSRSHYGIQSKFKVRAASKATADKWMTGFLEKWFKKFEELDSRVFVATRS